MNRIKIEVNDIPGHDDTKLVKINGELDTVSVYNVKTTIESYILKGIVNFIFDLGELKFIDSSGNFAFVSLYMKAKKLGKGRGGITLFNVNGNIKEIFDMIGISKLINIYDSYEEALLSFKK